MKTIAKPFVLGLLLATFASALAEVHYVDVNSTNATPPYTNWTTAATNIQDAVDAAVAGDEIVVTNGTYYPVRVSMSLRLRSVNGPGATIIDGNVGSGIQFRCAYLASGASLTGFTLTHGSDRYNSTPFGGGGVFCESVTGVVSNCVITGNTASGFNLAGGFGGGAYGGTLNYCTLMNNHASVKSGYTVGDILAYGGGAYGSTLNNCSLTSNLVTSDNLSSPGYAFTYGGGAYQCTLNNCSLAGNQAVTVDETGVSMAGGGAYASTLNNCIVYFNSNTVIEPHSSRIGNFAACTLKSCCTTPDPGSLGYLDSIGNITNAPLFLDQAVGNLRLQANSPCINAGNNSYVTGATDLDGNPRISGGTVDIGANEYQCPQLTLIPYGAYVLLTWPTNNAGYDYTGFTLQSTTNLGSPAVWSTNSPAPVVIAGQNTVTNPITSPQQFYRLIH